MNMSGPMNTDRNRVTVIIPTYNRANYLPEAISSILAQTLPPSQVIVVDDGSSDNTREVVTEFGQRIEYLVKPNGGKSSALNFALPHATGEFIWIFDDDDIAEPDALERLVHALQQHEDCGFAYGEYDLFTVNESGNISRTAVNSPTVDPEVLYLVLMERSFILQGALLVRKACYDEVGQFDEANPRSEDLDMMLRLARRYRGIKAPGVMFHQRQHLGVRGPKAAPLSADRMIEGWLKSDEKMFLQIYRTHNLADFLPKSILRHELTQEETITALMQRACIMARKGIWSCAAQDLEQIGEIAQRTNKTRLSKEQRDILRRVFDLFSYAPHSFAGAGEFRRALDHIRPAALEREIRAALLWSLPFTIGAARLNGHKANFYRFLRIYFQLGTPGILMRTLFDASFFWAGLSLARSRRNQKIAFERS
jgi:glycosyltransferase involved in cell wall biosynthesis